MSRLFFYFATRIAARSEDTLGRLHPPHSQKFQTDCGMRSGENADDMNTNEHGKSLGVNNYQKIV